MHQQPSSAAECSTIDEFCVRNRISRGMFYKLKKNGKAPRLMSIGTRQVIAPEAENEWRRSMEAVA
jgi:hypothetical protein